MDPWYESEADTSGVCDIGSHSLYYELRGIKNAVKVVMIMGLGLTTKVFNQLADRFARDFQVWKRRRQLFCAVTKASAKRTG